MKGREIKRNKDMEKFTRKRKTEKNTAKLYAIKHKDIESRIGVDNVAKKVTSQNTCLSV